VTESLDPSGDQWEIRELVERYAQAADQTDGTALAALFTDDGVLESWLDPTRDEPTATHRGHEEIARAINRLTIYRATHHTIASSVASIDGDRAQGETRCVAHHVESDDAGVRDRVLYIRYVEQFIRVDARWRFTRREVRVQWVSIQPVDSI
jgi:ketosteroid isomerase-like protein